MKIVAINGSPRGKESATNVMVSAFLKGSEKAGAETINIFLSEKDIQYCKGCYTCWNSTPGECIIDDDMASVISSLKNANVIILATPLYFNNVSGTLKVFIERLTATGNPHAVKDDLSKEEKIIPKLILISNCGFPIKSQFDIVSLWIKRLALMMQTEVIAEIYATEGKYLSRPDEEHFTKTEEYLKLLELCGEEIAGNLNLSAGTKQLLG
jgi:FMN-dependent NADH-azoreductase